MSNYKQQAYVASVMTIVSVVLTGLFFYQTFGLAMCVVSVLMQAAFMHFLPNMIRDSIPAAALLLATLAVSIVASASILSNTIQEDELLVTERALLLSQVEATQRSIEGYLEREYITKAAPLRAELKGLTEELNALPKTSDFYTAMSSIWGQYTSKAITFFVLMVSVMFDLGIVLLALEPKQEVKTTTETKSKPRVKTKAETYTDRQQAIRVLQALTAGQLEKTSVENVRFYLNCSQNKAVAINRLVKELQGEKTRAKQEIGLKVIQGSLALG